MTPFPLRHFIIMWTCMACGMSGEGHYVEFRRSWFETLWLAFKLDFAN